MVPAATFKEELDKFLADLVSKSGPVMMWTKKAIKAGMGVSFSEGLRAAEVIYMRGCMETKDAKEGITAFLEKRKPVWKDE